MKRVIRWRIAVGIVVILIIAVVMVSLKETSPTPTLQRVIPTKVEEKPLKFGVMADVHLNWDDWEKFLKMSTERGEKIVFIAGDMTSLGTVEELREAKGVLDKSGVKYYVVLGNHDLWESLDVKKPLYTTVFGKDYQSIKEGETKFILVNNGSWMGLGEVQRRWLEEEVGECRIITCVVIMHMPLNHSFSEHVMGEDNKKVTEEAKELIELFNTSGVKELITGHLHYSTSYELDGLRTTIVGAVSRDRNTQTPRYTEFTMQDGQLQSEVIRGEENDIGN